MYILVVLVLVLVLPYIDHRRERERKAGIKTTGEEDSLNCFVCKNDS